MTVIAINGIDVETARILVPGSGVWVADLDIVLGLDGIVPSGKATVIVGTDVLVGTIDDRQTGKNGLKATIRVVGGGGGWDKEVPALHLHNDIGVNTTAVYATTAASVGETVVDMAPTQLGPDYVRSDGPASRVFSGLKWYVDALGITYAGGSRPTVPLSPGVDILDWSPNTRRATLATDSVVWPGTILIDTRFGSMTVRDVELTFRESGSRAIAWCESYTAPPAEPPGTRIARAIASMSRESVGATYLKKHAYRVALQNADGSLTLQSVNRGEVPDILKNVSVWTGVSGASVMVVPGSLVLVEFIAGDRTKPIVTGFSGENPTAIKMKLDALMVTVGTGLSPAMKMGPSMVTWIAAVTTAINGLAPGSAVLPTDATSLKLFTD